MRGLSEAYGSWKTICMRRRSAAQLAARATESTSLAVGSAPSPTVGVEQAQDAAGRWSTCRSPTPPPARASRPGRPSKLTPAHGLHRRRPARRSSPARIGKCLTRSRRPRGSAVADGSARSRRPAAGLGDGPADRRSRSTSVAASALARRASGQLARRSGRPSEWPGRRRAAARAARWRTARAPGRTGSGDGTRSPAGTVDQRRRLALDAVAAARRRARGRGGAARRAGPGCTDGGAGRRSSSTVAELDLAARRTSPAPGRRRRRPRRGRG